MNWARLPSSRPGATAVRSACSRTCSTGDGRWVLIASPAADALAVESNRRCPAVLSAPRPVIPSHSASRSTAAVTVSMISPLRIGLLADALTEAGQIWCLAFGQCGQLGQNVAAQLPHGRIGEIPTERVDGAAATCGNGADEVGCSARRQPGPGEPDPSARGRPLLPVVVAGGGCPHRLKGCVVSQQACGISSFDDKRGMLRINIEDRSEVLEVPCREPAGTQDPRWTRTPVCCELVLETCLL